MSVDVLLAFSERDREGAEELERHLTPLSRAGKIRLWHRGKVEPGQQPDAQWRERVTKAPIILLLVSSDLENDRDSDIADALAQRQGRGARVIPVLWRAVNLNELRYRELRMIPDGGPVANRRDRDLAWVEVVQGIRRVTETLPAAASADLATDLATAPGSVAAAGGGSSAAPPTAAPARAAAPPVAAPPAGRIKLLFIGANPSDTTRLLLPEERREIDRRIQLGSHRDRFELNDAWAVTAAELSQTLLRYSPGILHFSGHGADQGAIVLNDDSGQSRPVSASALGRLFKIFAAKGLRCVVLNSCYSEAQAAALAQHVDCVIGITGEIDDSAALAFSAGFYAGLAQGEPVQTAFELGCVQIAIMGGSDPDQAKLLGRPGVDLSSLRLA